MSDTIFQKIIDKELPGNVARDLGVEDAFRLVINNGADAQQTVFHLHIHLIAGREFSWPPG